MTRFGWLVTITLFVVQLILGLNLYDNFWAQAISSVAAGLFILGTVLLLEDVLLLSIRLKLVLISAAAMLSTIAALVVQLKSTQENYNLLLKLGQHNQWGFFTQWLADNAWDTAFELTQSGMFAIGGSVLIGMYLLLKHLEPDPEEIEPILRKFVQLYFSGIEESAAIRTIAGPSWTRRTGVYMLIHRCMSYNLRRKQR